MKKLFSTFCLISFIAVSASFAQTPVLPEYNDDYQGVQSAILDYVEGLYLVEPSRIEKSVHKELRKRGYWFDEKENDYRDNMDMNFMELKDLAATWNKDGKQANEFSPKEIEIYDIHDKTATGKLVAEWGIDYFHLAKIDGKWWIMNVLWQSHNN
ncbi:MAG: nuclear transport factor 2 family protein [Bacteroidia bacterium]|nr:nuclear transport factor 2 family protein [Bacteroidia bacterium]